MEGGRPRAHDGPMSVFVWVMVGLAVWHFTVLLPDRFWGGIMGALFAAIAGALVTGYVLPTPGVPSANPPGHQEGLWPVPGSVAGLAISYWKGVRDG